MENYQITKANNKENLEKAYPVMKELRTNLSLTDFLQIYEQAHAADAYQIVTVEQDQKVLAVMGYRILHDFIHGKHLYIDDLVSTSSERSKGWGAKLLAHAEDLAKELGCSGLRLCTGIENEAGRRFYEKNEWNLRAIVYKKKLRPA